MNKKTMQWIRLISVPVFIICCFIVYTNWTKLYPSVVPSTTYGARTENLANLGLECVQLFGEDRKFQDTDEPQVECYTNTLGIFFWDFNNQQGSLQTTFYNSQPADAMGYIFNQDPGAFRVQFRDLYGNMETVIVTIEFTRCDNCLSV